MIGVPNRIRTCGLLIRSQSLFFHLSYWDGYMERTAGFEPANSCFAGSRLKPAWLRPQKRLSLEDSNLNSWNQNPVS